MTKPELIELLLLASKDVESTAENIRNGRHQKNFLPLMDDVAELLKEAANELYRSERMI